MARGGMSLRKRMGPEEEGERRLPWLRGASSFRDGEEKGFLLTPNGELWELSSGSSCGTTPHPGSGAGGEGRGLLVAERAEIRGQAQCFECIGPSSSWVVVRGRENKE